MRPRSEDALLITISAVAVAAGAFLLAVGQTRLGIATLVMFGTALGLFVSAVLTRRADTAALATPGTVEAVGGVRIPERKTRLAAGFGLVGLIGATFAWALGHEGPMPLVLGGLLVVVAVGGLAGVATGLLGTGWLQFTPAGLEVGDRKGARTLPWHQITGVHVGQFNRNAVVVLRQATGPDQVIFTGRYGLDAAWLGRAIARYIAEPAARAELQGPRAALSAGSGPS